MSSPSLLARVMRGLLYVGYVGVAAAAIVYVGFYRGFVADLRNSPVYDLTPARHVSESTMRRLGTLRTDRKSSFINFDPQPEAGVVRVCAFGDSFTFGDEVADGHDYPALLQEVLRERQVNAEVLNFGSSWYGFHQAHILWTDVGRNFGCRAILLGPACLYPDRDTTLNHTNLAAPYYLHARYVFDRDESRLIEVQGADAKERFENYFSFFPSWSALRFDRELPAALRSLVARGQTVTNPLYYAGGTVDQVWDEAYRGYGVLFAELARENVAVVLLHDDQRVLEAAANASAAHVGAFRVARTELYPNRAVGGHYSAFGNRLLAERYAAALLPGPTEVNGYAFKGVAPARRLDASAKAVSVGDLGPQDFERIHLRWGGRDAGVLAIESPDPTARVGEVTDLNGSGVAYLLGLQPSDASPLDATFVPLKRWVKGGVAIELVVGEGLRAVRFPLGRSVALSDDVGVGIAKVKALQIGSGELVLRGSEPSMIEALAVTGQAVTVLAGDVELLKGQTGGGDAISLAPVDLPLRRWRVPEGQFVAPQSGETSGDVTMDFERAAQKVTVPFARWRRVAVTDVALPASWVAPLAAVAGTPPLSRMEKLPVATASLPARFDVGSSP